MDAPSKYHNKVVDILVLDNRIAEIKSSINPASSVKIIQGEDLHASISWMDLGTQTSEPGLEHREDWGHWQNVESRRLWCIGTFSQYFTCHPK